MSNIKQKESPSFLYHYTKIENLALILQNRNIRFSSLNTVNDLTEGETSDYGSSLSQYVFVSCWMADSKEQIPMWHMYTPNMTGVRIKLPADPFQRYGKSIVPVEEIFYKKYSVVPPSFELCEMNYTDDENLLKPKFAEVRSPKEVTLNAEALGKYKPESWRFESEWRYILFIHPRNIFGFDGESYSDEKFAKAVKSLGTEPLPLDNQYFLKIHDEAFEQMEIMLGPKHSDGDFAIVKALIKAYNPNAEFKPSDLTGKIRK